MSPKEPVRYRKAISNECMRKKSQTNTFVVLTGLELEFFLVP